MRYETLSSPTTASERSADTKHARFDQALDRDIPTLRVIFSRWRQAVPHMEDAQRARILTYVEQHLEELEQLMAALRDKGQSAG